MANEAEPLFQQYKGKLEMANEAEPLFQQYKGKLEDGK